MLGDLVARPCVGGHDSQRKRCSSPVLGVGCAVRNSLRAPRSWRFTPVFSGDVRGSQWWRCFNLVFGGGRGGESTAALRASRPRRFSPVLGGDDGVGGVALAVRRHRGCQPCGALPPPLAATAALRARRLRQSEGFATVRGGAATPLSLAAAASRAGRGVVGLAGSIWLSVQYCWQ